MTADRAAYLRNEQLPELYPQRPRRNRNSDTVRLKMEPPLRLERRSVDRDGEKVNDVGDARYACGFCGGRSRTAFHPLGENGLPTCLMGKRGWQW